MNTLNSSIISNRQGRKIWFTNANAYVYKLLVCLVKDPITYHQHSKDFDKTWGMLKRWIIRMVLLLSYANAPPVSCDISYENWFMSGEVFSTSDPSSPAWPGKAAQDDSSHCTPTQMWDVSRKLLFPSFESVWLWPLWPFGMWTSRSKTFFSVYPFNCIKLTFK